MEYIGIDLAQKYSERCELSEMGEVVQKARSPTTTAALTRWCSNRAPATICIEAGGSSPWIDRLLRSFGHTVIVCNPRRVRLIAESTMKTDAADAEVLARIAA